MNSEDSAPPTGEPVELPIDGLLDLHTFQAKDVKVVVSEYLRACQKREFCRLELFTVKELGILDAVSTRYCLNIHRSLLIRSPASITVVGEQPLCGLPACGRKGDAPQCGKEM